MAILLATNQPLSFDARDDLRSRRRPPNRVAPWLRLIIVLVFDRLLHGSYGTLRARFLNRATTYRGADL